MLGRTALATLTVAGTLLVLAPPAQAASSVQLYKTQYDSPGTDNRSGTSLNAEYTALRNSGTTSHDLYWGSGAYIWNNTGDTATLRTASGSTRDTCTYVPKSADGGLAYC